MSKIIITVLLTGSSSSNLSPIGYHAFKESNPTPSNELSSMASDADSSGQWYEYRDIYCYSALEIEDTLMREYGRVPYRC